VSRGNPRQAVLDGLLDSAGLSEAMLVATDRLRQLYQGARAAMHHGDDAAFDQAARRLTAALAAGKCVELREQLRLYVVSGIRKLGARYLPRAERNRLEQGLVAVAQMKDTPCPELNRMLAPLVVEVHERLEKKHQPTRGAPAPARRR
jgi:hypothetical protein